ncbi:hypothetical protein DFJ58DRAFT_794135 [Suillus subalutaceus]|uniref:uncharacterized protein n=1 Tax=Suillus subalutaceus TaxID=48586 RepID=UPI001B85B489|nr:uncharacterized protein DFJ58DRAFT_794135 [Suillus subalutaceus]KAG1850216.1 hypothetical protein DFJ58DRAFT_794135 [Suillus subalutaceus]
MNISLYQIKIMILTTLIFITSLLSQTTTLMQKKQSEDKWQRDPVNPRNWSPAKKKGQPLQSLRYTLSLLR